MQNNVKLTIYMYETQTKTGAIDTTKQKCEFCEKIRVSQGASYSR